MISEEVLAILSKRSETKQANLIGNLTDEFRSGRDPSELIELLDSEDSDVIWIALYIIGEILIKDDSILRSIIERLQHLTEHEDAKIRYSTLIDLSPLLKETNPKQAKELYLKMSKDGDDGVRRTATKLLQTGMLN